MQKKNINPSRSVPIALLNRASFILGPKGKDYGYDNFVNSAKVANVLCGVDFITPDIVAACLIGVKAGRYGMLAPKSRVPNNESIVDTVIDLVNYVVLMERERQRRVYDEKDNTSRKTTRTR